MRAPIIRLALCLLAASLLAACSQRWYADKELSKRYLAAPSPCAAQGCLAEASAKAAASLAQTLKKAAFPPEARIVSLSFVNVDDLERSSTLGRLLAEQLASNLASAGYAAVDLKAREPAIRVLPAVGELGLSRASGEVDKRIEGQAMLAGTYAVAADTVFVDARVVRSVDQVIVAGVSFELPATQNVKRLLAEEFPHDPAAGLKPTVATVFPPPAPPRPVRTPTAP